MTGHDFLVEDCYFDGFKDNVVIGNPDTPITNFTIRRSQILDSYNHAGAHSQGLYASGTTTNLLIQDNVFDHNGWQSASDKTVFNHDMYINTGAVGTVVSGNVVTRSSLRGTLLVAGGVVEGNFYDFDAVAIQVGNSASVVDGNVILDGDDLPTVPSGVGVDVAFSIPSVQVTNNIIAHDDSAYEYNLSGINLNGGTHLATVTGNIVYDWRRALIAGVSGGGNTIQQNVLEDFDGYHPLIDYTGSGSMSLGNNSYYEPTADNSTSFQDGNTRESFTTWSNGSHHPSDSSSSYGTLEPYIDPNRDMAGYNASLSASGTFNDWINAQRGQTREGSSLYAPWYQPTGLGTPSDYTAAAEIKYIKDGFSTSTNTQSAQVVNIVATDPNASEAGLDPGTFSVTRSGTALQLALPLTVTFDLGGSATLNTDYTLNRTTITFPAATGGATTQTLSPSIIVTPKADAVSEGDETVKISLRGDSSPVPAYTTGLNPNATVTIADATSSVNVVASTSTAEIDGAVPGVLTLTRTGSTAVAMTVNVLWSGAAVYNTDYTASSNPTGVFSNPDASGNGTVTFPIGSSSVDITITPINTGVLHGIDPVTLLPEPGTQDVGLTVEPPTGNTAYAPGISPGATVTIDDPADTSGGGGGTGGGGGGGLINPPPLGHGLSESYIATQDDFIPPSDITSLTNIKTDSTATPPVVGAVDQILGNIQAGKYGTVLLSAPTAGSDLISPIPTTAIPAFRAANITPRSGPARSNRRTTKITRCTSRWMAPPRRASGSRMTAAYGIRSRRPTIRIRPRPVTRTRAISPTSSPTPTTTGASPRPTSPPWPPTSARPAHLGTGRLQRRRRRQRARLQRAGHQLRHARHPARQAHHPGRRELLPGRRALLDHCRVLQQDQALLRPPVLGQPEPGQAGDSAGAPLCQLSRQRQCSAERRRTCSHPRR